VVFIREHAGLESGGTNREQVAGGCGSECSNRLWRGRYITDRGFRNVGIYKPDAGELP
jgi:hypothetical protein